MGIMRSSLLKEDSHSKFHAITGVRTRQAMAFPSQWTGGGQCLSRPTVMDR